MKTPFAVSRKISVFDWAETVREGARIVEEEIFLPNLGQVLIRNRYAGINALFDRAVVRDELPYRLLNPPFDLGVEAVGEIVAVGEDVENLQVGDFVSTTRFTQAYREYQTEAAEKVWKIPALRPEYVALRPTAVSALVALEQVGQIKDGETVAITAAAGGLGQFVMQFAKMRGCRVVGICGGAHKVPFLRELGCDAVIDYKTQNVGNALRDFSAKGIDLAYDTVGGTLFDTLLDNLAVRGRIVVSGYAADMGHPGLPEIIHSPRVYAKIYWKAAQIRCFQNALYPEFHDEASRRILDWYHAGQLQVHLDKSRFRGIEQVFDAIESHLLGESVGKVWITL